MYSSCSVRTAAFLSVGRDRFPHVRLPVSICRCILTERRFKGEPITTSRMPNRPMRHPDGKLTDSAAGNYPEGPAGGRSRPVSEEMLQGGDVLMKPRPSLPQRLTERLTERRHVDLVRVSSALCRPSA
ncbi:putative leader peptide [Streptomyces sp. NPDC000151]|uniref:putative leader peptide n=1 Tax=Streptomyces sp. NPDC000151 TaxID=3154244 RepID=UPI00332C97D8